MVPLYPYVVSCPTSTKSVDWYLNIYYLHNCIGLPRTMYNQFCCIFTNTLFKAVFQKKSLAYNKLLSNGIFLIEKIALNDHKSGVVFLKIVSKFNGRFFFLLDLIYYHVVYSAISETKKKHFSNFSCMFLNLNNFFQFEFYLF